MKKTILSAIILSLAWLNAAAWGQKGHDVTAYIAEQHLTPKTKATVDSLLNGMSMVYWANWLDNASNTPEYAYTKTWHYKNVDEGVRYEEAPANPAGDAVLAIKSRIEILTDPASTPEERDLALKILIHVTGDIHCPMHMGHATDRGGNRVEVNFFNKPTNLHSVWDSSIPEAAHKWSYSEWQQQINRLTPEQQAEVVAGSIDDWAKQTLALSTFMYERFQPGCNIAYREVAECTPIAEQQFVRGGLRLAHLLNSIYDPDYGKTE